MTRTTLTFFLAALLGLTATAASQAPLLHYPFDEGGSPPTTKNFGTLLPANSPRIGHTLSVRAPNGSYSLRGVAGASNEITTPFNVNLGNSSWTMGFHINTEATNGTFQYIAGDGAGASLGWRIFANGGAGANNIVMTGMGASVTITNGAGSEGWVHVAWMYDANAGQIRAYRNGLLQSSTPAGPLSLNSGRTWRIGRQSSNAADSLQTGSLLDDFRLYGRAMTANEVSEWARHGRIDFRKLMITEVSWGDPDGVEITNFGTSSVNLNGWRLHWQDSPTNIIVSSPLNVTIAPNEAIVVGEPGAFTNVPSGTQVLTRFGLIGTNSAAITVGLLDTAHTVVDEVRISNTNGTHPGYSFGGSFRGIASRGNSTGTSGEVGIERIWGLDSNSGADWTEQPNRSFGLENRNSGPRGTDPISLPSAVISEVDDSPDYIEINNRGAATLNLQDWFLLCSAQNGSLHTILRPFAASTPIVAGGFVVVGGIIAPPAEIPASAQYINAGTSIPYSTREYDCALYDRYGRLIDLVRTPNEGGVLVHNHPRAPSHWTDFRGAAGRTAHSNSLEREAIARINLTDTNSGADWAPVYGRTMGFGNTNFVLSEAGSGLLGPLQDLDVRCNEGLRTGNGLSIIINAGSAQAAFRYSFFLSAQPTQGKGPFFGLGVDALANYLIFSTIPPFTGVLDAQGSARFDFAPGTLPPNLQLETMFVLFDGANLAARTHVVPFDT